ncbi:hypothetical protein F2P81_002089 [Scophthalmus maximus]|uniref:Uncharacterized protein n=1 Tax=Scophthalmus maximus TaxID=52904 RepID=A0A6A4TPT0_SCOMX|nr:hypothetical protein F2P81_002089 [Scophthalmus maximus]
MEPEYARGPVDPGSLYTASGVNLDVRSFLLGKDKGERENTGGKENAKNKGSSEDGRTEEKEDERKEHVLFSSSHLCMSPVNSVSVQRVYISVTSPVANSQLRERERCNGTSANHWELSATA